MSTVIESSATGAGGVPSTLPAAIPRKQLAFLKAEKEETPPALPAVADHPQAQATVAAQEIDEVTAVALAGTRLAFFAVQDAGRDADKANRRKQGELLLEAQKQLARYGTGTFTAMLLAPRPEGFGVKSATSAYELMAEAEGKPKRSHKGKKSASVSTPGRSNESTPSLPLNVEGAVQPPEQTEMQDGSPSTLDTSHTHTYVPFRHKGVYVPKADVEAFSTWLQQFSLAALSLRFLGWYKTAKTSSQEEAQNAASTSIQ